MESKEKYYYGTKELLLPGTVLGGAGLHFSSAPQVELWSAARDHSPTPVRIYQVEPLGIFEALASKLPQGPAVAYRALHPVRVLTEVTDWQQPQAELNSSLLPTA